MDAAVRKQTGTYETKQGSAFSWASLWHDPALRSRGLTRNVMRDATAHFPVCGLTGAEHGQRLMDANETTSPQE